MLEVDESILDKLSEAFYLLLRGSPAAPIELPPEYPENEVRQLVGYINRFLGEYGDLSGGMSSIARAISTSRSGSAGSPRSSILRICRGTFAT